MLHLRGCQTSIRHFACLLFSLTVAHAQAETLPGEQFFHFAGPYAQGFNSCIENTVYGPALPDEGLQGLYSNRIRILQWSLDNLNESRIQRGTYIGDSVLATLRRSEANIIFLTEIASAETFNRLLAQMPGFSGFLSAKTTRPHNLGVIFREDLAQRFSITPEVLTNFEDLGAGPGVMREAIDVVLSRNGATDLRFTFWHGKSKYSHRGPNIEFRMENEKLQSLQQIKLLELFEKYEADNPKERRIILGDFNDAIGPESENYAMWKEKGYRSYMDPVHNPDFTHVFKHMTYTETGQVANSELVFAFSDAILLNKAASRRGKNGKWPVSKSKIITIETPMPSRAQNLRLLSSRQFKELVTDHRPLLMDYWIHE